MHMVVNGEDGSSFVLVFDPKQDQILSIRIPPNTQVEVARRLGIRKIKSVWELGVNEGVGGQLLAETVTRYFKFPVTAWSDSKALKLTSNNPFEVFYSAFGNYDTNLTFGDRVSLALFAIDVPNTGREEIDLADTAYLKETLLRDGENGYVVTGVQAEKLYSYFADETISNKEIGIGIRNGSTDPFVSKRIGEIVEVLGAKAAAISEGSNSEDDCLVRGNNMEVIRKIADIFSCTKEYQPYKQGVDIEIVFGESFSRRF